MLERILLGGPCLTYKELGKGKAFLMEGTPCSPGAGLGLGPLLGANCCSLVKAGRTGPFELQKAMPALILKWAQQVWTVLWCWVGALPHMATLKRLLRKCFPDRFTLRVGP